MLAANRFKVFFVSKIHQGAETFIYFKNDVSSLSSVTAGRAAFRHIFFTAKRNHTVAAVAAFYIYFDLIYKHNVLRSKPLKTPLVQPNFNQTFVTRHFKTHDINVLISILPNIIKSRWIGKGAVKIKVQNQLSVRMIRLKRNR